MVSGLGLSLSGLRLTGDERTRLKEACKEVESLFLYLMLKEMQKDIGKYDMLAGSREQEIYRDMRNMQLARVLAQESVLGISDLLYRSMEKFV